LAKIALQTQMFQQLPGPLFVAHPFEKETAFFREAIYLVLDGFRLQR